MVLPQMQLHVQAQFLQPLFSHMFAPTMQVLTVIAHTAAALGALEKARCAHADIKPANILVSGLFISYWFKRSIAKVLVIVATNDVVCR